MDPSARSSRIATTLVAGALIAVAGCGSSSSGSKAGTSSSSGAASSSGVSYAQTQVAKFKQNPVFSPPGPAFDAKKLSGSQFFSIPVASFFPFTSNLEKILRQAANEVGIRWSVYNNQGQPSQWIQGMNTAISQKVKLIDLLAAPSPFLIKTQIDAARRAGIAVVASHDNGFDQKLPSNLSGVVAAPYRQVGQLLADWVTAESGGDAHVLVVTGNDIYSSGSEAGGMKSEFAARCPKCEVQYQNVPSSDWAQKVQPTVAGALVQDPKLKYIIDMYDGMASFTAAAVTAAGKSGQVHIATFNGDPNVLQLIQQGKVDMDISEPLNWVGRAILDAEMRIALKLPAVTDEKLPLFIFDKSNVAGAGNPPQFSAGFGNGYGDGYEKLWGVAH